jgi:putative transposase
MDNVFIERVWRSLKHEDVYLKGYADGREARAGIGEWIVFCNERRLHQALRYRAPMAVWREGVAPGAEAHTAIGGMIDNGDQQTDFRLDRRQEWSRCAGPLHLEKSFGKNLLT